ncbi:DUF4344 domain-containing metallopeptidase [Candidatus Micrarchaeota archaeon]|nr:DUF4344 domain-containing metallopeptidase [Candidatus Micrarchaeota archaeon]
MEKLNLLAIAGLLAAFTLLGCAAPQQPPAFQDLGDFRVQYIHPQDPTYQQLEQIFKDARSFEEIASSLNEVLKLPQDIDVILAECGEENAFYNPENKSITMCYELIGRFGNIFQNVTSSDEELGRAVLGSTLFTFFHEMGHALIDIYTLPTTGKEEDAVDQLSTLILLDAGKEGEDAVISGAAWFYLEGAQQTNIEDLRFWDEHGLSLQRYYNTMCLVYGKDPDGHSNFVTDGYLPEDRAAQCPYEYPKIYNSWNKLLEPYLKQ